MSPSPFAEAASHSELDLDAELAETVTIIPMDGGRYGEKIDHERLTFDVAALVDYTDPSAANIEKLEAMIAYEQWDIEIRNDLLPPGFYAKKNDQVQLVSRPGSPRARVTRINKQDPNRTCLTLSPVSGAET